MSTEATTPLAECDLVMKGGITSGIVYPPAVLELATRYRFRSIGGTSAGAIAAAATAAAEHGRDGGGFERLREVNRQLAGGTFLRDLFQPSPRAQPLLDAALGALESRESFRGTGTWAKLRAARSIVLPMLRGYAGERAERTARMGAQVGIGVALAITLVAAGVHLLISGAWSWGETALLFVLLAAIGAVGGGLAGRAVGAVGDLLAFFTGDVCGKGFFGLCSGSRYADDPRPAPPAVLTDWLSGTLNRLAGLPEDGPPLCFGDLEGKGITLRMVTSNLSQTLPFKLPFDNRFAYRVEEWERLFPPDVMAHLAEHAHQSRTVVLPEGFRYLPDTERFPVVVAARMSLSFPVLISAIPLYLPRRDAFRERRGPDGHVRLTADDMQLNLFSDGGIASNFPIHFFDQWFPARPTFGISLATLPPRATRREGDGVERVAEPYLAMAATVPPGVEGQRVPPGGDEDRLRDAVYLPRANDPLAPPWAPSGGVLAFLGAIFSTAQNYRDTLQEMLPSYRERVATVRLSASEGGLNLAMAPETIARVMEKGRQAGERLRDDFRFDHHQWVRLRVLMGQVEANLREAAGVLGDEMDVEALADAMLASRAPDRFPYPRDRAWVAEALRRVRAVRDLADDWSAADVFAKSPPHPEPVLRIVPDL